MRKSKERLNNDSLLTWISDSNQKHIKFSIKQMLTWIRASEIFCHHFLRCGNFCRQEVTFLMLIFEIFENEGLLQIGNAVNWSFLCNFASVLDYLGLCLQNLPSTVCGKMVKHSGMVFLNESRQYNPHYRTFTIVCSQSCIIFHSTCGKLFIFLSWFCILLIERRYSHYTQSVSSRTFVFCW